DGCIRVWNLESTSELHLFGQGESVATTAALSEGGSMLAVADAATGRVHLWDTEAKALLWEAQETGRIEQVAFARDNKHVVVMADTEAGKRVRQRPIRTGVDGDTAMELGDATEAVLSHSGDQVVLADGGCFLTRLRVVNAFAGKQRVLSKG